MVFQNTKLFYMNCRLSKIRSIHTYVIHRMVYYEPYCIGTSEMKSFNFHLDTDCVYCNVIRSSNWYSIVTKYKSKDNIRTTQFSQNSSHFEIAALFPALPALTRWWKCAANSKLEFFFDWMESFLNCLHSNNHGWNHH